jgi:hypothetical protein
MHYFVRSLFIVAAVASLVPVVISPPVQARDRHCCCRICWQPCGHCICQNPSAPAIVPQTTYQPIVETQYVQQPVLQQRDVVATEYRTEPVVETVPATVVENVTVDEGSYQSVWVPRQTTKSVARTTYESRTSYRTVPYQVTRRVSEYATQTIPYQTVRYVPATGNALADSSPSGFSTAFSTPTYSGSSLVTGASPNIASAYPTPVSSPIFGSATSGLVPASRYADAPATPITPRGAATASRNSNRTADRGTSLFVPAPSAALVWQTPRSVIR